MYVCIHIYVSFISIYIYIDRFRQRDRVTMTVGAFTHPLCHQLDTEQPEPTSNSLLQNEMNVVIFEFMPRLVVL